jgi:hypothetical protein
MDDLKANARGVQNEKLAYRYNKGRKPYGYSP